MRHTLHRSVGSLLLLVALSGCQTPASEPLIKSDQEFDQLDESAGITDAAEADWSKYSAAFFAHPDTKGLVADMVLSHQCAFLKDEGSVSLSAPFVLVTIPGECADGAEAMLTGLFSAGPAGKMIASGEIAQFTPVEEEVSALALFDVNDTLTIRRDIAGAALEDLLVADDDDDGVDEVVATARQPLCESSVAGISCTQQALTMPSNCSRCKRTLQSLFRTAPCSCKSGPRTICGMLKRSSGKDGVLCRRTVRAACKTGVSKLKKLGAQQACESKKIRLCRARS